MRKIFLIAFLFYLLSSYLATCPALSKNISLNTKEIVEHYNLASIRTLGLGEVKKFVKANIDDYEMSLSKSNFIKLEKIPNFEKIDVVVHKWGNLFNIIKIVAFICMMLALICHSRYRAKKESII